MENGFLKFVNGTLGILFIASIISIIWCIYYFMNPSETVNTAYVDSLTYASDSTTEVYPWEITLYDNENNNGIYCVDIKNNYYTDSTIPTDDSDKFFYSAGYQCLDENMFYTTNEAGVLFWWASIMYYHLSSGYYYNTTNQNVSYEAINALSYDDSWVYDYGDGAGLVKVNQKGVDGVSPSYTNFLGWKYFDNRDIYLFLYNVIQSASSLADGDYVLAMDFSEYFSYKIYNEDDGTFSITNADEEYLFFNVLVHKSSNGLVEASQSLFGMVGNDSTYRYDSAVVSDYWASTTVYTLTASDFTTINSGDLVLGTLSSNCLDYLSVFDRVTLLVNINLDVLDIDGFAQSCFGDEVVGQIVLSSIVSRDFYIYDDYTVIAPSIVNVIGGGS